MSRLVLAAALLLLAACALRPHYNDIVPEAEAADANKYELVDTENRESVLFVSMKALRFVLLDRHTGQPVANASIGLDKRRFLTDDAGVFQLPVTPWLRKANPMVVVSLPANVLAYDIKRLEEKVADAGSAALQPEAPGEPPMMNTDGPPASEETPAPEAAPEAVDGGSEAVSM